MTFEEVLPALKDGKKIRRNSWYIVDGYKSAHIYLNQDKTKINFFFETGTEIVNYEINLTQILADDWEIGGYKYLTIQNQRDIKIDKILD
jgi:hypothetical protein